jgi:hypothetical protein
VPKQKLVPSEGMKWFTGYVSIGLVGCKREFAFEIEEDATEQEIEEAAKEAMFENIEWNYEASE